MMILVILNYKNSHDFTSNKLTFISCVTHCHALIISFFVSFCLLSIETLPNFIWRETRIILFASIFSTSAAAIFQHSAMDEGQMENESLQARIQQLELERDKLHKNVEELCMQKAGPEFVNLATQTYFRRTAGLEQEVENLKKEKADCEKENSDIKNQLSEAMRIKAYLEQLHELEVSKNAEAAKQLEYLRDLVATAFSDRDRAVTEAEKAKESEEIVHQKLKDAEMREQELKVGSIEKEEQIMNLQMKLDMQEQDIENCKKVIEKFYKIRQDACRGSEDEEIRLANLLDNVSWNDKCAYLYDDPTESWSFIVQKESPSANDVLFLRQADLLQEVDMLRGSVDDLQKRLQMGLETEKHLESRISFMEQEKILSDRHIVEGISSLREYHSQQKIHIMKLLDDERSFQQSVVSRIDRKIGKFHRDVQASEVVTSSMQNFPQVSDFSESLALALEEKVSALILLSQQEERHIWEKNVHAAVHETVDELQRSLKLASAQKVKALMELAELKQQYQQLLEITVQEMPLADSAEQRVDGLGRDGKLTNLFKKTSFGSFGRRWLGTEETPVPNNLELERFLSEKGLNHNVENARLRIEYATLKDSVDSLERLTTDIRQLRLSLIQAKMTRSSKGAYMNPSRQLDETIRKAETLKNSLTSALQLSWTDDGDASSSSYVMVNENPKLEDEKIDTISTVGLEMVELLIMAAHIMKEKNSKREPKIKKEQ
ncbi:uncharacterized protein LOC141599670 isoform X2 [Silene latifolia]|uniref:uncharacterized protein LOC141599670 isoform X2 n=1 Tax=Silene latifolia TaxID=37657 RepID=UPI003D77C76A